MRRLAIIFVTTLILVLPATANAFLTTSPVDRYTEVYCTVFGPDGNVTKYKFNFSQDWIEKLIEKINETISRIIELLNISAGNNTSNNTSSDNNTSSNETEEELPANLIEDILQDYRDFALLPKFRPITQKRVLIISKGHGRTFTPLNRIKLKIHRSIAFWHYKDINSTFGKSTTIIVDPVIPRLRILKGTQFGMMRRFVGIYIYIPRPFHEGKGQTFFVGYAYKVRAFDLLLHPLHR